MTGSATPTDRFETPKKLHYSQTLSSVKEPLRLFETPKKLHYSQTRFAALKRTPRFETPKKLHYSQTSNSDQHLKSGLRIREIQEFYRGSQYQSYYTTNSRRFQLKLAKICINCRSFRVPPDWLYHIVQSDRDRSGSAKLPSLCQAPTRIPIAFGFFRKQYQPIRFP